MVSSAKPAARVRPSGESFVSYGNGQFVVVGSSRIIGPVPGRIRTSADGVNWVQRRLPPSDKGIILSGSIIRLFKSIYAFGYSWTDTHNCDWPSPQYYKSRACNGPMWPEFLSTNLELAYVEANNYAHCGDGASEVLN